MGATPLGHLHSFLLIRFNPRPPRKVGATSVSRASVRIHKVSILAHPERWALPPCKGRNLHATAVSILAHPERWALRFGSGLVRVTESVSILAHPERWALRRCPFACLTDQCCFNPRPPRKVGATSDHTRLVVDAKEFQSSPTPKGGRYGRVVQQRPATIKVSILAHPERWALLYRENLPNFQAVNISIRRTSFSYGIILIHLFNHMLKPLVKSALFRVREPPGFLPVL